MANRKFMTAILRIPVEIFEDESYQIYTDLYKIDFSDSLDDPDLIASLTPELESETQESPSAIVPFIEKITQILANEIKPRRNRTSTNTTFKNYSSLRKSNMRFSRKQKDPIRINSSTEDADLFGAKTETA
jgi:hypothetical protein